jgi:transposase-like protein
MALFFSENTPLNIVVFHQPSMNPLSAATKYTHHRFSVEIVSHAVWRYFRFCLRLQDGKEKLCARGVVIS